MPDRPGARVWMLVMAFAVTVAPDARGQKDALTAAPERAERELVERWKREAAEYTIVAHGESEETLTLDNKPALRWTNPVRSTDGGLVFIWTAHGRPETVSCFYRVRWEGRLVEAHEFLSLARVGLTGSRGGRTVWSPKGPGIDSRPIPDAPKPASTPSERLRQVRALARDFRANIDTEKSPTELRMLSQPAFRFEANEKPRTQRSPDGALFAFVLTTDPEAWLLIEERPADAGPAWHYGFARMTNHSVTAKHRNRTVWEVARDPDDGNPGKPFCSRWDVGPKP